HVERDSTLEGLARVELPAAEERLGERPPVGTPLLACSKRQLIDEDQVERVGAVPPGESVIEVGIVEEVRAVILLRLLPRVVHLVRVPVLEATGEARLD